MNYKNLINQESIIFYIFLLIAVVLVISKYGTSNVIQSFSALYCILQLVINLSTIYSIVRKLLKKQSLGLSSNKKVTLLVSFGILGILFFTVLTEYFKGFVRYYSCIILSFLLIYDIGKIVLKKSF